jgi:hypothetical protein
VAKTLLVEKEIEVGKKLIEELDKTNFSVRAALWFYLADSDEWRLLIASPYVEKEGPKKSYNFIQSVLAKLSTPSEVSLRNISAVPPSYDLIKLIRRAIRVGPGISGIWFTGNVINNVLIDDAYIYRIV